MAAQRVFDGLSFEQFEQQYGEDKAELVGGTVIEMPPTSRRHQEITLFLARLFSDVVEASDKGFVFSDVFTLRLEDRGRKPDVMVVLTEHEASIGKLAVEGRADLVVEVISPDSIGRDRGDKYIEYEAAGVTEYWLIDPEREVAEFYVLQGSRYQAMATSNGRFQSVVLPEINLDIACLWQSPLPKLADVRRSLGL